MSEIEQLNNSWLVKTFRLNPYVIDPNIGPKEVCDHKNFDQETKQNIIKNVFISSRSNFDKITEIFSRLEKFEFDSFEEQVLRELLETVFDFQFEKIDEIIAENDLTLYRSKITKYLCSEPDLINSYYLSLTKDLDFSVHLKMYEQNTNRHQTKFFQGYLTKENAELLSDQMLKKWADSYGYTEQKSTKKGELNKQTKLNDLIQEFFSRDLMIASILEKQKDLIVENNCDYLQY